MNKTYIHIIFTIITAILAFSLVCCAAPGTSGGGGGGTPKVETPELNPAGGLIQQDDALIVISTATPSATIYYTIDGTTPSTASFVYGGPIPASQFAESPPARVINALAVAAGMDNSDVATGSFTITDTQGPLPAITSAKSGGTNVPFAVTITFNEIVTGFDLTDISLSANTNPLTPVDFTDANPVFTVNITPNAEGFVTADIPGAVCTDEASSPNNNSAATQWSIYYDPNAPQAVITSGATNPVNTSPIPITITFDRNVINFDENDLVVGNGNSGTVTGGPAVYFAEISPLAEGTVTVDIADSVCEAALTGSPNIASVQFSVTYDITGPSVTINQAGSQTDPSNDAAIDFTVVFTEGVLDFDEIDVAISGTAGATTAVVTGSGTTYNVAVSGMTLDGTVIAAISAAAAHDAAGNASMGSTSTDNIVSCDNTAPTVTINQAGGQSDPSNISPVNFTVVFSESVTGFANSDVTLSGSAGADAVTVTGSGATYNVAVSGMTAEGTVIASIAADAAYDAAGNGNPASTSTDNTVAFDGIRPSVTVNQAAAQLDPTNGSPVNFTVIFSEPVADFDGSDAAYSGTAAPTSVVVTGSGTTYNVAVSGMTSDGTVVVDINADVAHDGTGNANTASTSTDNTVSYDATAPTVTINQATGQADPSNGSTINFEVFFSESVTGFVTGDVTLSGTAGATTGTVTGSGTTYNVAITGMTGGGTVIASLMVNVGHDAAGNGNTASTTSDNTVTYDITKPGISSITSTTSATTGAYPMPVTIVFSEAIDVSTFSEGDISVTGTAGATVQAGSLTTVDYATWSFNVLSGSAGSISITMNAGVCSDLAGNTNNAAATPLARTFITAITWGGQTAARDVNTATITTAALNITNQPNRILLVGISTEKTTNPAITVNTVVFNSGATALAAVPGATRTFTSGTSSYISTIWYVVNPPVANATITVTLSAAPGRAKVDAYWAYNANTASAIGAVSTNNATVFPAAAISTSITSIYYYSMLIDNISGSDTAGTITATAPQTRFWSSSGTGTMAAGSRKPLAATAAATMAWTVSNQATALLHSVVELKIIQ